VPARLAISALHRGDPEVLAHLRAAARELVATLGLLLEEIASRDAGEREGRPLVRRIRVS
jgi:hypothetical protein